MALARRLLAALLIAAGLHGPLHAEPIEIEASPIAAFERGQPERTQFGSLEFLGGLELTSPHPRFGGLSGVEIAADGGRIAFVTDRGDFISAMLDYEGERPAGLVQGQIHPLVDKLGAPFSGISQSDAEALRAVSGEGLNGEVLVSFERNHRILRYRLEDGARPELIGPVALPEEIDRLPDNEGIEAIAVLPADTDIGGAIVAIAEGMLEEAPDLIPAWSLTPDKPLRFSLEPSDQFKVTDAVALPDGDLVILERRFSFLTGVAMRLRLVPAGEIAAEATIVGERLLTASMAYQVDNMEAIAAHRDDSGRTVLTIVSDDNFNILQRTILLQFAME